MTKPKPPAPPRPEVAQAPMTTFCAFPRTGSHGYCHEKVFGRGRACHCSCHTQDPPPSSEGFDLNPPKVLVSVPPPVVTHAKISGKDVKVIEDLAGYQEKLISAAVAAEKGLLRIHLGPTFWDDHVERAGTKNNPHAGRQVELRRYVKTAYVELDAEGYDDLLAAARWFADPGNQVLTTGRVVVSARATVRALEKAGRPG